jgi:hypothetical protein
LNDKSPTRTGPQKSRYLMGQIESSEHSSRDASKPGKLR